MSEYVKEVNEGTFEQVVLQIREAGVWWTSGRQWCGPCRRACTNS